jgi:hypothetical protein
MADMTNLLFLHLPSKSHAGEGAVTAPPDKLSIVKSLRAADLRGLPATRSRVYPIDDTGKRVRSLSDRETVRP